MIDPHPPSPDRTPAEQPVVPAGEPVDGGRRLIEKMWVLVVVAALLFNPPLLRAFGVPVTVLGWPLLYVYVFVVWGLVIALAARLMDRGGGRAPR